MRPIGKHIIVNMMGMIQTITIISYRTIIAQRDEVFNSNGVLRMKLDKIRIINGMIEKTRIEITKSDSRKTTN